MDVTRTGAGWFSETLNARKSHRLSDQSGIFQGDPEGIPKLRVEIFH